MADASNAGTERDESSVSEGDAVDANELVLDIDQSVHESMDEEKGDDGINQSGKAQTINLKGRRRQSFLQMSLENLGALKDQVDDMLDSEQNEYQEITGESVFQKFPLPEVKGMTRNRDKFWISSCSMLVLSMVFIVSFSCIIYVILSELLEGKPYADKREQSNGEMLDQVKTQLQLTGA